jgi:hypothetical protein
MLVVQENTGLQQRRGRERRRVIRQEARENNA